MLKYFLLSAIFGSLFCFSDQLVKLGQPSPLSKEQFRKAMNGQLVNIIDEHLSKSTPKVNANHLPLRFHSYLCGTKQVVSGIDYQVEFLACPNNSVPCNTSDEKLSKCTMNIWFQPWLVGGIPMSRITGPTCQHVKDLDSVGCTLLEAN